MRGQGRAFLSAQREKLLYLVVGGWNTVFQYGVFSLCWYLLSKHWGPIPILLLAYVIGSVNGFLGFRYVVFKPARHPLAEYLRFQAVYLPLLVINLIGLPALLRHTDLNAYAIQALFAVAFVIIGYVANRFFTFRRPGQAAQGGGGCAGWPAERPASCDTRDPAYCARLARRESVWWKRCVDVQRPYRWNLRRLDPGFVLDVGCGLGRNLAHLDGSGVGIDHNPHCVEVARSRGWRAYLPEEFAGSEWDSAGRFDTLLMAHAAEHMSLDEARGLLERYLGLVKPGGRVIIVVPQKAGFHSDQTHVQFVGRRELRELASSLGLAVIRLYSFPFPSRVGRFFRHNETVAVYARASAGVPEP